MDKLLELVKNGSITGVLENVAKVASVFNPALGSGLMLASNLTEAVADVPDDFLENDVIGLSGTAQRLEKMVESKQVDFDELEMLAGNLKSIASFSQKTAKLIK